MNYLQRKLLLLILFLGGMSVSAVYGQVQADSLRQVLSRADLTQEERIMTMGKLAYTTGERFRREAVALVKQALRLSYGLKDGQYSAFSHAMLGSLYMRVDSVSMAREELDSARWYLSRTENRTVKGVVYYMGGSLFDKEGKPHEALKSFFQALRLLDGQQSPGYESAIYYQISNIYADWQEWKSQQRYALLCMQLAKVSGDPDHICSSYQSMANYYERIFRRDTTRHELLDSALYFNRQAIRLYQDEGGRMVHHSMMAVLALNTAGLYARYFHRPYKDTVMKYLDIALETGRRTYQQQVVASVYGMLSDYAIADHRYDEAERLLMMGFMTLKEDISSSPLVMAQFMRSLSAVAEMKGELPASLRYLKQFTEFYKDAFDAEKVVSAKRLEAQFETERKERELVLLEQRASFNKKLNFFYISLAVASLLALLFLFLSYHFRLKSTMQQQRLLAKEKEDAALQARLKTEENKRLELEKQEVTLQAKLKEEEAMRLQAEQQLLQERQERLQKDLLAGALQVEQKNELLQSLQKKITEETSHGSPVLRQLNNIINQDRRLDEDFDNLKSDLKDIHPEFFVRLQEKAVDNLTRLDMRHCAYILMGLSVKEIAQRMSVEPKSIRMARYRIKQKLALQKDESLDQFILSLGESRRL
ncbi:hypothetical protein KTO58_16280 [Chitinophaga pendula]|uniref:helix-turn-helix transcriptional regulator n=1 Tax=Chitinophaga TaxID=79328 RepID=UPI0012FDD7D5|nr:MULTISPECIES: hypothetical protein [Chitinophaga]UCJ05250.1 hypothetical protein KTO58_16280 [Chitinophaga pendula]